MIVLVQIHQSANAFGSQMGKESLILLPLLVWSHVYIRWQIKEWTGMVSLLIVIVKLFINKIGPEHDKTNKMTCVPRYVL